MEEIKTEHIKKLIKKVNEAVQNYNKNYENEESMANDLLVDADEVIMSQHSLIIALQNGYRNRQMVLEEINSTIEQFEKENCKEVLNPRIKVIIKKLL